MQEVARARTCCELLELLLTAIDLFAKHKIDELRNWKTELYATSEQVLTRHKEHRYAESDSAEGRAGNS